MKKIELHIDDKVFKELRSHVGIKGMCGNLYGVIDAFNVKIIKAIENGDKELHLSFKKRKEDEPE